MKILLTYPPLSNKKGIPLLSQNRQFQFFKEPTYIFPVIPATAATLLKSAGYEVIWKDCIAENISYDKFLDFIKAENPDLIALETKTPVIKEHWRIIDDIKALFLKGDLPKIVLFGDHVTALPEESFQRSKVDFILTGGDYDFLLLSLCKFLGKQENLEPGIYYRENGQIKNSGKFRLSHDLDSLPFIDRELTQSQLYAYKNGNYKKTPGTYIMSGRDCWWGKCTFCLEPSTSILTDKGTIPIKELVDNNLADKPLILTHKGFFRPAAKAFKRFYKGSLLNLEFFSLKQNLNLTPNHKIFVLRRSLIKRCSKKCNWSYLCLPGRKSNRLHCSGCQKQYYKNYQLGFIESDKLQIGDFVAIPIIREIRDESYINVKQFLEMDPPLVKINKRKSGELISWIIKKYNLGFSQRQIARELFVDRQTVKRYIALYNQKRLDFSEKSIVENNGYIKYVYGKKWIPVKIPLSNDFLRFVGYYLAEGHVSIIKNRPNSYCLCLTFSVKETGYIKEIEEIINKLINKADVRKHINRKNNTIQLTINSSILAVLFKRLFGDNCYNKKIPSEFLYLPLEKQKELLRGLFRGDGHLRIRNKKNGGTEYILETVSGLMAQQVLNILFRNEAIPRFRICRPRKKGKVPIYSISLCRYDIERIFPDIKLSSVSSTYRHGFILNDFVMIPIKRILRNDYEGTVYNLEVENEHSYVANNIAVSNCSWPTLYPQFRARSVDNVLNEIGQLIEKYHFREIMDDSGSFPVGDWLKAFCSGMINRNYNRKVYLDCNMRFGALSYEEFALMKKANFRLLLFGLESANQETLDRLNKGLKVERIIEDCKAAAKAGLFPHITIMFGYPWESYEDALKTLKLGRWLLNKGYAYTMQATMVVPYPGTPLFEECKQKSWLKTLDWEYYDMKKPVMQSPIPDNKIMELVQGMYKVSFQPEFIVRKLFSVRDIDDLKYSFRAAEKVFGHIFDFSKNK